MAEQKQKRKRINAFQVIILGFIGIILLGALILMLPISSASGEFTPFNQTLFTATSATCVTGLVVQDTATHWSVFGQVIILIMIQIGGLGVITVAASIAMLSGRKITLMQRSTMKEAIAAPKVGGIVKMTRFVLKGTFLIELFGAVAMMPVFISDFGAKGIWMAFFHSISAFCNAGFDLMGTPDNKFCSLTAYAANPVINVTVILLIVIGGIGFLTWQDICINKFRIKKYKMQTKVILTITALLIFLPALFYFFFDFADLPFGERVAVSLFQSVTARTAGFNTVNLPYMTKASLAVFIILMLIGGSPGSTAGGMKTTTFAVLISNAIATFRRKEDPQFFGRRIEADAVKNAATLLLMYVTLCFSGAALISIIDGFSFGVTLYEAASAVGTVGVSMGITPYLGVGSQAVLMVLMFLGRVGGLTVVYAALMGSTKKLSKLPQEKIIVG